MNQNEFVKLFMDPPICDYFLFSCANFDSSIAFASSTYILPLISHCWSARRHQFAVTYVSKHCQAIFSFSSDRASARFIHHFARGSLSLDGGKDLAAYFNLRR